MTQGRKALVQFWLEKAEECIASAKSEIEAGRLSFAYPFFTRALAMAAW